jgi:hypothetical protein
MSMARLWDQGKREEARELVAPVYGWFTEGFDIRGSHTPIVSSNGTCPWRTSNSDTGVVNQPGGPGDESAAA